MTLAHNSTQLLFQGQHAMFLHITVRRDHIVRDALTQVCMCHVMAREVKMLDAIADAGLATAMTVMNSFGIRALLGSCTYLHSM
jgi:hypothetical protein